SSVDVPPQPISGINKRTIRRTTRTLCIISPLQLDLPSPVYRIDSCYAFAVDCSVRLRTFGCRNRNVLVNLLSLVVVVGMKLPVRPGDELGRLVSFEPFVKSLFARRQI